MTVVPIPGKTPSARFLVLNGIFQENPVFRLALSLCPAVAVTTTVINGLILGVAVLAVQVLSSCTVALTHAWIHPKVRIPIFTIIIAVWVSAIDMTLAAFLPGVYAQVGLYVKLIVAFAIIISRLEVFASRHPLAPAFWDGLGMGLGFLIALAAIGAFRELLGNGSLAGVALVPVKPLLFFALPAGGFFSIALLMAFFNLVERKVTGQSSAGAMPEEAMPPEMRFALTLAPNLAAILLLGALAAPALPATVPPGHGVLRAARVLGPDHLRVKLSRPLAGLAPASFRLSADRAPDVPIEIRAVEPQGSDQVLLTVGERVDAAQAYLLVLRDPPSRLPVRPAPWALLLRAVMSAALINNFVFTRYLGLCIFFGVSRKRDTAIGMGITFTMVMIGTAMLSWALYTWAMVPLKLKFLQVLVFIGVVAVVVQFLDTMLKKTHSALHKRFGIYLVLITTNCIILAVPLLNAASGAGPAEAAALALGSGLGFALALFLMSGAREKIELARVPRSFAGLPIAFALAGLFALAFMGFSGLNFLR